MLALQVLSIQLQKKRSGLRLDLHLSALFALSNANASPLLENNWFVLRARDHKNDHLWEELKVFLE